MTKQKVSISSDFFKGMDRAFAKETNQDFCFCQRRIWWEGNGVYFHLNRKNSWWLKCTSLVVVENAMQKGLTTAYVTKEDLYKE